jgi:hypothetical protein
VRYSNDYGNKPLPQILDSKERQQPMNKGVPVKLGRPEMFLSPVLNPGGRLKDKVPEKVGDEQEDEDS